MDLQRFAEERRFPATPRRRREARRRGSVARSADLSAAVVWLSGIALVQLSAGRAAETLGAFAVRAWSWRPDAADGSSLLALLGAGAEAGRAAVVPILAGAAAVALAAGVAQTGPAFVPGQLLPQWSRVNPLAGLGRLFSGRTLLELVKTLVKLAALGALAYGGVVRAVREMPVWLESGVGQAAESALRLSLSLLWEFGLVLLLVGAADWAYQRAVLERNLRMTREELREELRESEGDPELRARIRRRQREIARRRMLADVRLADVVVTNPTHYAVALRYRPGLEDAPVVLARGKGHLALRIRELAYRHGVTVMEDPPLAQALYAGTKVGQPIPIALYQAVARVLAYVWRLKGRVA
ncbi:MAG: EscU/YscU/HrcU family type III secretion system export apparatus switch protein [Clostridia bacterium]|nr:EscU/YscU/HrcU family type III secretion system export apparatus switch protein [Clostridia bacterium]